MGNKCCKSNQSSTYSSANVTIRSFPSSYNSSIVRSGGSHAVTFGTSTRGNSLTDITMKSSDSDVGRDYRGGSSSTVGQENPIPVFLRRLNDLNIRVGTRTRFLIELDDPTGVQVRWFHNNLEAESDRYQYIHEGGFFCLDIVPVTLADEGLWVCTAQNYAGKSSTAARLSLTVPKAFKKPVFVEPLRAVLTQRGIVSLECKVVGVPTPRLRWYKDDKEIKAGDIFALTASASEDCLGVYTCEATNVMGTATSASKIQVTHASMDGKCDADSLVPYGPPPKFVKGLKDASGKVGSVLFLECQVEVPPWPRNVGWYNNNGVVNEGPLYHLMADGLGMYGVEIKSLRADHGSAWKCVATSSTGAKAVTSCLVSVSYPKNYRVPRFLESLRAIMTDEGLVSFECKVIGYPTPQLSWFKDGKQLQPGDVYELTGSKSLGSYCCVARNCMGETSSLAELTIEDIQNQLNESEKLQLTSNTQPPRFLLGLKSTEANINESFVFMIKVSTESTPPSISWYKEDEELAESNRYRFSAEGDGTYTLNIVPLEIDDQAEWKCVAVNKYGQTVTSSFLKLNVPKNFKPPRFLEELRIAFSNEGSVNLECKVIGVPQPLLKWFKDGQELNPGDMHKIISGQSGTCCLGTYTCQAHNCMGTVSSSATLLTMEDKSTVKSCASEEYLSVGNPLVRNESLSTIPEERTSQMEKSYTIEEPADVSFSFDGKEVTVSLYETPDLTHDEALQIIEMYADELSEHISEDNVVDLPSLRIVKESSISGPVMMEALVIDVPVDFCRQQTVSDTEFDGVSLTEDTTLANNDEEEHSAGDSVCENSLEYFSDHLSSSGGGNSRRDVFFSASETTPKNGSSPHISRKLRQRSGGDDGDDDDDDDDDEHASFRTPKLFMSDSDDQMLTQLMLDGERREPPVVERPARSESSNNCTEEEVSETLFAETEPPPSHGYFAPEILARSDDEDGLYAAALDKIRGLEPPVGLDDNDDVFRDVDEFLGHVKVILESTVVKMHARQSFAEADATPTELERSIQALHTLAWRFVDETERRRPAELDRHLSDNASALMTAINAGMLALDQIDDPFGVSDNVLNEIQSAVCFDLETLNNRDLSAAEVLDLLSGQVRDFTAVVNKQVARVTEQRVVAVLRNTIGTTLVYIKTLQGSKVKYLSANALTQLLSMVRPLETILEELAAAEEAALSSHDDGESSGPKLKQRLIPPISAIAFCLDNLNAALKDEHADEDDPDLRDIYNRINDSAVQFMALASRGSEAKNLAECFIAFTKPINDLCCHLRRIGRSTENIVSSDYGSDDKLLMDFETLFDELMMDIDTLINNVNVVRDSENNMNPLGSLLEPLQDMKIGLFQVNQVLLSNQTGSNMSYEVMSCFEHLSHQLVQLNSCIVNQSIVEETDKEIPFESSIKMMQNILFDDAIDDLGVNGILFGSVMKPLLQLQNLIVSKMASVESDLSFSEHTDITGDIGDTQSLSLSLSNNAQTVLDKTGDGNLKRDNTESSSIDIVAINEGDRMDDVQHAGASKAESGSKVIEKNANEDTVAPRGLERDIGAAFKDEEPNIITPGDDRDNSGFEALFGETDLENDFVEYGSLDNNMLSSQVSNKSSDIPESEQSNIGSVGKENNEVIPEHIMELLDKSTQEDLTLSSTNDLFDELQETLKNITGAIRDDTSDMYLSDDDKVQTRDMQESSLKMIEDLSANISTVSDEEQKKRPNYDELIEENQLEYTKAATNMSQDKTDILKIDQDKPLNTKESEIRDQDILKLEQTDRASEWDVDSTENIECIDSDKSTSNNTIVPNDEISDPTDIKTEEINDSSNSENIDSKCTPVIQEEENEISMTNDPKLEKMDGVDKTVAIVTSSIDQGDTLESTVTSKPNAIELAESKKDSTDAIVSENDTIKNEQNNKVDKVSFEIDSMENKAVYAIDNVVDGKTESAYSLNVDAGNTIDNAENLETQNSDINKMSVKGIQEFLIVKDDQQKLSSQNEATIVDTEPVKKIEITTDDQIPQTNDKNQNFVEINEQSIAYDDHSSKTDMNKSLGDDVSVKDEVKPLVIEVISSESRDTAPDSENNKISDLPVKSLDDAEQIVEEVEGPKKPLESNSLASSKDEIIEDTLEISSEKITPETNKHKKSGEFVTEEKVKSDTDLHENLPTSSQIKCENMIDSTKEPCSEESNDGVSEQIIDKDGQNANDGIIIVDKELSENIEQNSASAPKSQITKFLGDKSFANNELRNDEEFNEQCVKVSNNGSDNNQTELDLSTQITEEEPIISPSTVVEECITDDLKNIEDVSDRNLNVEECGDLVVKLQDAKVSTQVVDSKTADEKTDKKNVQLDAEDAVSEEERLEPKINEGISIKSEQEMTEKLVKTSDSNDYETETDLNEKANDIDKKLTLEVINEKECIIELDKPVDDLKQTSVLESDITTVHDVCETFSSVQSENIETTGVPSLLIEQMTALISNEIVIAESPQFIESHKSVENQVEVKYEESREKATCVDKTVLYAKDSAESNLEHSETEGELKHSAEQIIDIDDAKSVTETDNSKKDDSELTVESLKIELNTALTCTEDISLSNAQPLVKISVNFENSGEKEKDLLNVIEPSGKMSVLDNVIDSKDTVIGQNINDEVETHKDFIKSEIIATVDESIQEPSSNEANASIEILSPKSLHNDPALISSETLNSREDLKATNEISSEKLDSERKMSESDPSIDSGFKVAEDDSDKTVSDYETTITSREIQKSFDDVLGMSHSPNEIEKVKHLDNIKNSEENYENQREETLATLEDVEDSGTISLDENIKSAIFEVKKSNTNEENVEYDETYTLSNSENEPIKLQCQVALEEYKAVVDEEVIVLDSIMPLKPNDVKVENVSAKLTESLVDKIVIMEPNVSESSISLNEKTEKSTGDSELNIEEITKVTTDSSDTETKETKPEDSVNDIVSRIPADNEERTKEHETKKIDELTDGETLPSQSAKSLTMADDVNSRKPTDKNVSDPSTNDDSRVGSKFNIDDGESLVSDSGIENVSDKSPNFEKVSSDDISAQIKQNLDSALFEITELTVTDDGDEERERVKTEISNETKIVRNDSETVDKTKTIDASVLVEKTSVSNDDVPEEKIDDSSDGATSSPTAVKLQSHRKTRVMAGEIVENANASEPNVLGGAENDAEQTRVIQEPKVAAIGNTVNAIETVEESNKITGDNVKAAQIEKTEVDINKSEVSNDENKKQDDRNELKEKHVEVVGDESKTLKKLDEVVKPSVVPDVDENSLSATTPTVDKNDVDNKVTKDEAIENKDEKSKIKKKSSPKSKKLSSSEVLKSIDESEIKIDEKVDENLKKPLGNNEKVMRLETKEEQEIPANDTKSVDKIQKIVSIDEKSENQKIDNSDVNKTKTPKSETIKDSEEENKLKKKSSPKSKKLSSSDISKNIVESENKIDEKLKKLPEEKENVEKLETKVQQESSADKKSVNKIEKIVLTDENRESKEADVNKTKTSKSETVKDKDEENKIKKKSSPKSKKISLPDVSKNIDESENKIDEKVDEKLKKLTDDKENVKKLETKVEQEILADDKKSVNKIEKIVSTDENRESKEADVNKTKTSRSETVKDKDGENKIKKKSSPKSKKISLPDVSKNNDESENKIDEKLKKLTDDKENVKKLENKVEQEILAHKKSTDKIEKIVSTDEKSENKESDINETKTSKIETMKDKDEENKIQKTPSPKSKKLSSPDVLKNIDESKDKIDEKVDEKLKKPSEIKENVIELGAEEKQEISVNDKKSFEKIQKCVLTDENSVSQKTDESDVNTTKTPKSETIKVSDDENKINKKSSPKSKKLSSSDVLKNIDGSENKIDEKVDEKLKIPLENKEIVVELEVEEKQEISASDKKSIDKIQKCVSTDENSVSQKTDESDVNTTKTPKSETIKEKDEEIKIKKTPSPKSKKLSSPDTSKNNQDSENKIKEKAKNIDNDNVDEKLNKPLQDNENDIKFETKKEQNIAVDDEKSVDKLEISESDKGKNEKNKLQKKPSPKSKKSSSPVSSINAKDSENKIESNAINIDGKVDEKSKTENSSEVETKVETNVSTSDKKVVDNIKKSESDKNDKSGVDETKKTSGEVEIDEKKRGSKKVKVSSQQPQERKSSSPDKLIDTKKDDRKIEEKVASKSNALENENLISHKQLTDKSGKQPQGENKSNEKVVVDDVGINEKLPLREGKEDASDKNKIEIREKDKNKKSKSPDMDKNATEKSDKKPRDSVKQPQGKKSPSPVKSAEKKNDDQKIKEKAKIESAIADDGKVFVNKSSEISMKEVNDKSEIHVNDKNESILPETGKNVMETTEKEPRGSVKQKTRRSKHKKTPSPEKAGVKRENETNARVNEKVADDGSKNKAVTKERDASGEGRRDRSRSSRADVTKEIEKSQNRRGSAESKVSDGDRTKARDERKDRVGRSTVLDAHDRSLENVRDVTGRATNDAAPYKTVVGDGFGRDNSDRRATREPSSDRRFAHDSKHVARTVDGGTSGFDRATVNTSPSSREFRSSPSIVVERSPDSRADRRDHDLGKSLSRRYLNVTDAYASRSASTRLAASRSLTPEPVWRAGSVTGRGRSSSDRETSSSGGGGGRNYFGGSCRTLSTYCAPDPVTYRCPTETSMRRYRPEDESSSSYWASYGGGAGGTRRRRGSDSFLHDPGARDGTYYSGWRLSDRSTFLTYTEDLNRTKETFRRLYFCVRLIDQTVCSGSTVKFWCSVIGYPEPHVQWYRDGQKLNNYTYNASTRYRTKYTGGLAQLIVDDAQCCDSGEYTCVAANSRDRITTTGFLTVYTSPSTFGAPSKPSRTPSASAPQAFRPQDRLYAWNGDDVRRRAVGLGADYDWSAGGRHPKYPKFVTGIIADDTVTSGGTIALQVRVRGSPAPNVTWLRDSKPLPLAAGKYVYLDEGGLYTLLVKDATARDGGAYVCRACNLYGSADAEKTVRVADADHWSQSQSQSHSQSERRGARPATIVSRPGDRLNVAVGEDITVTLRVAGEPKPKVIWMRGSRDVTFLDRSLKETVNDYVKLSIKKAQLSDAGTYFIVAKNVYGSDRAFVTVGVRKRARSLTPPPPRIYGDTQDGRLRRAIATTTTTTGSRRADHDHKVPGPVPSEPAVTDRADNRISLRWDRPEKDQESVLVYMVEARSATEDLWRQVGMTPTNNIDVYNLKPGNRYGFRVTARNRFGWGQSVATTDYVDVSQPKHLPEFCQPLPGVTRVLLHHGVVLQCHVRGVPEPRVTWFKDGELLAAGKYAIACTDRGKCTLTIAAASDADAGRYACEAVNDRGRVCTLTVVEVVANRKIVEAERRLQGCLMKNNDFKESAPIFTKRLTDRRVEINSTVRLSCQVNGLPMPAILWYKDGRPVDFTGDDATNGRDSDNFSTLELIDVKYDDSGAYSAIASNSIGTASTRCVVEVINKNRTVPAVPELIFGLPPTLEATESIVLNAQVNAYRSVKVEWSRDGIHLRNGRRVDIITDVHDGNLELRIAGVTKRDSGTYTLRVSNDMGTVESRCDVDVVERKIHDVGLEQISTINRLYSKKPKFVVKPKFQEVEEGQEVVIDSEIIGDPSPKVTWLRDGLKPEYYRDNSEFLSVSDGNRYQLKISHAKLTHTGTYTLLATNPHGQIKALISLQVYSTGHCRKKMENGIRRATVERLPRVSRGLVDIECCENDNVTFECKLNITKETDVRWQKDGKLVRLGKDSNVKCELVDGDTARLEISTVSPMHEGLYTCTAFNELGQDSTSARLIISDTRDTKSSAQTNGQRKSMLGSPTLAGEQPCNDRGSSKRLKRSSAPKFYAVLHDRIVDVGDTVRFQCSVSGHPPPWSSWEKDGQPVGVNSRMRIREDDDHRSLEICDVTADDAGLYRVTVENKFGKIQGTARLEVLTRHHTNDVQITSSSPSSNGRRTSGSAACKGEDFTLSCDIRGNPKADVTWYKDDSEVKPDGKRIATSRDGLAARLWISDLEPSDAGAYTCVARSESGVTRCSTELSVFDTKPAKDSYLQPPIFVEGLVPKSTAREGERVQLTVKLQGAVPMSAEWFRDDEPVPDCEYYAYVAGDDGTFGLSMIDPFVADSGTYSCKVINTFGEAVSYGKLVINEMILRQSVEDDHVMATKLKDNLNVKEKAADPSRNGSVDDTRSVIEADKIAATILWGSCDTTVLRGAKLVLETSYSGNPKPRVQWLRADKVLRSDEHTLIADADGMSSLTIDSITTDDCGKYAVRVDNGIGNDYHFAWVAVEGPPDPPPGRPVVSVSETSANVTWSSPAYDGGCMVTGYSVEVRPFNQSDWRTVADKCHSLSHIVRGLAPGESYVFRVRAENMHGSSEASSESVPMYILQTDYGNTVVPKKVAIENGEIFNKQYEVMDELGKGRFGVVYKAKERESGKYYAAKFVRCIQSKDKEKAQEEVDIMNCLRHPKLLQLDAAFENPREVVMVTEYISGGELFERVVADDFTLTEKDCILFTRQICEGVDYMHRQNVVHLDLKPENIMCQSRTSHQIKLIDFGLARKLQPDKIERVLFGTPEFIPPEIISFEPIGLESDMWSVGVICYVLLSGLSPFMGDNDAETFTNITRAEFDFDDEAFDAISQDSKDFISALLIKRKEKRLTAKECLKHKWLAQQDMDMSCVILSTDKLKKFIIRRKWQKTGNAIRALGRLTSLSAATRRGAGGSAGAGGGGGGGGGAFQQLKMASLSEEESAGESSPLQSSSSSPSPPDRRHCCKAPASVLADEPVAAKSGGGGGGGRRSFDARSDSGFSDCSSLASSAASYARLSDKPSAIAEETPAALQPATPRSPIAPVPDLVPFLDPVPVRDPAQTRDHGPSRNPDRASRPARLTAPAPVRCTIPTLSPARARSPAVSPVRISPARSPVLSSARSPVLSAARSPVLSSARSPVLSPARSPVLSSARSPVLSSARSRVSAANSTPAAAAATTGTTGLAALRSPRLQKRGTATATSTTPTHVKLPAGTGNGGVSETSRLIYDGSGSRSVPRKEVIRIQVADNFKKAVDFWKQ